MNILFVSHEYGVNGATRSLIDMIDCVRDTQNMNIQVLIPRNGNAAALLKEEGIKYKTLLYYPDYCKIDRRPIFLWEMFKEAVNAVAVMRLFYWCKKQKIDIIHSNSTAVDIGARVATHLNLPHVFHIREFMEEDFRLKYRNGNRMKRLIEQSQYCVFISKVIERKYIKLYNIKKNMTLYNRINTKSYYQRREDLLKNEKINLIMTGGIVKGKGVHIAVRAVNEVVKRGLLKVELFVIGNADKKYLSKIKEYINEQKLSDSIHIRGFVSDVAAYRKKADVCLVCSDCEGFGRVTIESMLAGLLVIGSDSGATTELIKHNKTGLLYEKGNIESLASCIECVGMNSLKYKEIAKNGQNWALQTFESTNYAEKIMNIWRGCIEKRFS